MREEEFQQSQLQSDAEFDDDEEVPTVVLIVVTALAILTVVLYMTVAGGHSHFH